MEQHEFEHGELISVPVDLVRVDQPFDVKQVSSNQDSSHDRFSTNGMQTVT